MNSRSANDWIYDIRMSFDLIWQDIGNMNHDDFYADGKTVRAVVASIANIGEASKQVMSLHPEFEHGNPELWSHLKRSYAMRNKILHGYFQVDPQIVWTAVTGFFPGFQETIDKIKSNDGENGAGGSGNIPHPS